MDVFVVFFDAQRPVSHFGWNRAFCGAEMIGGPTDRHGWQDVTPCPSCINTLPSGERHIFRSADAEEAICGALRDHERPITAGIDPTDPAVCDRCLLLDGASFRILTSGAYIPLVRPRVFRAPVAVSP